jgi:protein-tyrosine phosphatase
LTDCFGISVEIHDKFEDLEWMQRVRLTEGMLSNDPAHPYYLESDPKVKARNRYVNVQAWANSRIHLRVPEGECDFINASPITLKDSATQEKRKYIATQVSWQIYHP